MKPTIPGLNTVMAFVKHHQGRGIRSTRAQVVQQANLLYNVDGSTKDPKKIPKHENESWMKLLKDYGINGDCFVTNPNASGTHPQFNVGGHVTPSANGQVAKGGTCYLMPMCNWHNHPTRDGVAFQHANNQMLQLTGYFQGELAATFMLRLPSSAPFALLYFVDGMWNTRDLSKEEAANLPRLVQELTCEQQPHYVLFEREGGEETLHYIRNVNLPDGVMWNRAFSNLIRQSHANVWGNWELDPAIAVGAVGYLDPETGSFVQVTSIDPAQFKKVRHHNAQDWVIESTGTRRTESSVDFKGGYLDPTSGVEVNVGTEIAWGFSESMGLASNASIVAGEQIDNFGFVLQQQLPWLASIAKSVGYGDGIDIAQGFGVVTSTIIAGGVVNVASQEADNTFSITGSVDGVAGMTGDGSVTARLGGSYMDTNATKSVDSHIYPSAANTKAEGEVAIAFNFASFDGTMILPSWVQKLDPLSITFDNANGGTYLAKIEVTYNYEKDGQSHQDTQTASVSGGLQTTLAGIPLNATNLIANIDFVNILGHDTKCSFTWLMPATSWLSDRQTIDLHGVWPSAPSAKVRSR